MLSEFKKDACSNAMANEQAKNEKGIYAKSQIGKVTYMVAHVSKDTLSKKRYDKFFNMLDELEKKLPSELEFCVPLDYMTIGAFVYYFDEKDLKEIAKIIDIRVFELLTDVYLRKNLHDTKKIADNYLDKSALEKLKEYYDKNHEFVLNSFSKGYSTLSIFDMLNTKYSVSYPISNLCECIRLNNLESPLSQLAAKLVIELDSDFHTFQSESAREDLFYEIYYINKNIYKLNNLDVERIHTVSISNVYDYIKRQYSKIC